MKTKDGLLLAITLLFSSLGNQDSVGFEKRYIITDYDNTEDKWFGDYYDRQGINNQILKVGGWGDDYYTMIRMPIHFAVPGRKILNKAYLNLYSLGSTRPTSMHKLFALQPWSEYSTVDHWGDIFTIIPNQPDIPAPQENGWHPVDITQEFFLWINGQYANNGVLLYADNTDNRFNYFVSSENERRSLRPFIELYYEEVPNFKLPLPGGVAWKLTVEAGGRQFDSQTELDTHHLGTTYFSLDFSPYWVPLSGGSWTEATDVPIYAAAGGVVVDVGTNGFNGWYVKIDHDYDGKLTTGCQTIYIHMKEQPLVVKNNVVEQGRKLGIIGNTGISFGTHLHMTFYFQNGAGNPPNYSTSTFLDFIRMEGRAIKNYKIDTVWHPELNPDQYTPTFYPSSNNTAPW